MFIPIEKMKALREASKNGDERAKKILMAQLNREDYSKDLDDYFAPKVEEAPIPTPFVKEEKEEVEKDGFTTGNSRLDSWLLNNNIKEDDEDYEDALHEYFNEYPNELDSTPDIFDKIHAKKDMEEPHCPNSIAQMGELIVELIKKCDELLIETSQKDDITDTVRTGTMTILQEVKQNLFDDAAKLKKIKNSFEKSAKEEDKFEEVIER